MITEREDKLFKRWKTNREGFVSDGVADEKEYNNSKQKILFVLKEANDLGGGGWDIREYMRGGGRAQTWNNITRWIEGIRSLPDETPWEKISEISQERRIEALKSVAAMNLKKSPGSHTTDPVELSRISREDKLFLNEQFSIYLPDIVVCCGTHVSNIFHCLIDAVKDAEWKCTSRGIYFHEYLPEKFVISYSHPEARVASNLLYYGLVDAIREITHAT